MISSYDVITAKYVAYQSQGAGAGAGVGVTKQKARTAVASLYRFIKSSRALLTFATGFRAAVQRNLG